MTESEPQRLSLRDYLILAGFCLVLFAYSVFSGRPLTMHEARLPQTAREMQHGGDMILPHSGGRPWLERPPLPHWIVIATNKILGEHQKILTVRLPSALCGIAIVLLMVWMTSKFYSREIALLSGYILATMYEFYQYASLAEDDIYLALIVTIVMAIFVRVEWFSDQRFYEKRTNPFGGRAWPILVIFILVGLTNLTKGLLLGMIVCASTLGIYLISNLDAKRFMRYAWVWGWLAMLGVGVIWPIIAYMRYPDVWVNWKFDYGGRMGGEYSEINKPFYYYTYTLLGAMLPWTPAALVGLRVMWPKVKQPFTFERLMWCWAIVPVVVFSIPSGKHHHYLVPMMAPWGVIGAIGLKELWSHLKERWPDLDGRIAMRNAMILMFILTAVVMSFVASKGGVERDADDTRFIRAADKIVPAGAPYYINSDIKTLDFFRLQFYSRVDAKLIHNLTFLRDEKITSPDIYLVTRARDEKFLNTLGGFKILEQSKLSHGDKSERGRFTLYHLMFHPDLQRYPCPPANTVTNMQGLQREKGPYCGPAPE